MSSSRNPSLTRSAVRIYGALSALGDGSIDPLQQLIPFFEPYFVKRAGAILNIEDLVAFVRSTYHWSITTDVAEVFMPRLEEAGWIQQQTPGVEGVYVVTLPEMYFAQSERENTAEKELRELAENFKKYSDAIAPLLSIPKSIEEYEEILIEWLIYIEAFREENLKIETKAGKSASGKIAVLTSVSENTTLADHEKTLCASFVEQTIKTDEKAAEKLARLASIGLLTEVVQDFVRPTAPVKQSDLVVYLDAPLAMELLGVSGKSQQEDMHLIVRELQRVGASVRVFSESLSEISRVLNAVLKNRRAYGLTAQSIARGELLPQFVSQVASDPEGALKEHGVGATHRTLKQFPNEHEHFSNEVYEDLLGGLSFHEIWAARVHDASITAHVMRMRGGKSSRDIFASKYIALTRNRVLAQVTERRCRDYGLISRNDVPPVVHRRALSAAMWLRTGLGGANLEVPKRMLLSSCEHVLSARKGVVDAVRDLTDALGDEEKKKQLEFLLSQERSTRMLMDKTLGASSVVTQENLGEIIQQMRFPIEEGARKEERRLWIEKEKEQKKRLKKEREAAALAREIARNVEGNLKDQRQEDRKAILALCRDASIALRTKRNRRKLLAAFLALIFASVSFFLPSQLAIGIGYPIAVIVGYFSIAGLRIVKTTTDETEARIALQKLADQRQLREKLGRFTVTWRVDSFDVAVDDLGE
ncbi:hypothetical protein HMH01_17340 [Halovulum dunhuangense]|uniref:Uncharacterized protein n=1 Tax=Halovulum dunhuangense TaxID=1505036 RepID=A0A849L6X2_9RHOB|nr:hypothetical protein [Halovulum dunhuangense]NNU82205.1 hypothetical protein [Halovulum dunhuangense]